MSHLHSSNSHRTALHCVTSLLCDAGLISKCLLYTWLNNECIALSRTAPWPCVCCRSGRIKCRLINGRHWHCRRDHSGIKMPGEGGWARALLSLPAGELGQHSSSWEGPKLHANTFGATTLQSFVRRILKHTLINLNPFPPKHPVAVAGGERLLLHRTGPLHTFLGGTKSNQCSPRSK